MAVTLRLAAPRVAARRKIGREQLLYDFKWFSILVLVPTVGIYLLYLTIYGIFIPRVSSAAVFIYLQSP
eukprot:COSAG05_NODE_902_length_6664_cov_4.370754_2_plen_69_part_00